MAIFSKSQNTKELVRQFNAVIVTKTEVEQLLEAIAKILIDNLQVESCSFYIRETPYSDSRFIGLQQKKIPATDLERIRQISQAIKSRVYLQTDKSSSNEASILKELLEKHDISLLGRLVSTLDFDLAGVGYMLVGTRKSGKSYSKQEVKALHDITNELVHILENALRLEEIEHFNATLQKKIDDATKELKASNDKLRALDEAKDEFVSMASHQLRTPLTSIKGYISMVLDGDAGKINDEQRKMLGQALFSSQRMVYLIADLLNVSRLKTGKFTIEKRSVYLPDVIESEIEQLYEGANAKNVTIAFKKPKEFATLTLDEMKIRQVVMNFADNAIYYTLSGGKITVELKQTTKTVEFTVKDTGMGVPKDQQHKLFTKFYRADNAKKARPDGTGLGLFMAKKIIIAQGGSIIFKSTEGKGSTFGFSFPRARLETRVEEKH